MKSTKIWFKLFASCIIVDGYNESLIYDLERSTSYILPKGYSFFLKELQKVDIDTFKENSTNKSVEIDNFINKFLREEIGFTTDDPKPFTNIELTWKSPYLITNAIIQITNDVNYDVIGVFDQLDKLGCQAIQLRIESNMNIDIISGYLSKFNKSRIRFIELIIPFNEKVNEKSYFELMCKYPRIGSIKIYNAIEDLIIKNEDKFYNNKLIYLTKNINQINEVIRRENFRYNIPAFTEAQNHNIGLNRKVCITKNGDIKNHLSHKKKFGNINKDKIGDIVSHEKFQKTWFISNDLIEKCKDCQYRYTCVSNSDIKVKNKLYSKIELCGFDPYLNHWNF